MGISERDLSSYLVAAARRVKGGGRLVVVGNSQFLNDKFAGSGRSENGTFGLNAVDWLAQDVALSGIRTKSVGRRPLVFGSEGLRDFVRYLNLIGIPVLVAVFGMARMARRRKLSGKVYEA